MQKIPTHNVESENTWTFSLINSAPELFSNVILDQRNINSPISARTCRCTDFVVKKKLCVLGKLWFAATRLNSSQSLLRS